MTPNILLVGGLGYIGSVLYDIIKEEGWNVEILDNHLYKELEPTNVFTEADTRNKEVIKKIIQNQDV
ncbi:MAG: NAD-dependent epimerase/dehydratase family protein, partial [Promethearchaeota archaeon]